VQGARQGQVDGAPDWARLVRRRKQRNRAGGPCLTAGRPLGNHRARTGALSSACECRPCALREDCPGWGVVCDASAERGVRHHGEEHDLSLAAEKPVDDGSVHLLSPVFSGSLSSRRATEHGRFQRCPDASIPIIAVLSSFMQLRAIESQSTQSLPILLPRCSNATPVLMFLHGGQSLRGNPRARPSGCSFGHSSVRSRVTAIPRRLDYEKRWPDIKRGRANATALRERRAHSIPFT
jgi:hypothetical protein